MLRINITSVLVNDQEQALRFYTDVLGFVKQTDLPVGEYRWLTVGSPAGAEGIELLLEPNAHPAARAFQRPMFNEGIPATTFGVDDLDAEYDRLTKLGVRFQAPPTRSSFGIDAVFEDTCGNLISIHQA